MEMEGIQEKTTSINQQEVSHSPFALSHTAVWLLANIADRVDQNQPVFVGGIPSDQDSAFAELMARKLVQLSTAGTGLLVLTQEGRSALHKGVIIQYPLTNRGTASDYFTSLITQTTAAANALLSTITNLNSVWFDKMENRKLASLFQMFVDIEIFKRLPRAINETLYANLKRAMEYYSSKASMKDAIEYIYQETCEQEALLNQRIKERIEELEGLTFKDSISLRDSVEVTGLSIDAGQLVFNLKDNLTGNTSKAYESEMNLTIHELYALGIATS